MELISNYINGNHNVNLYSDGTKIKQTLYPQDKYFTYNFPESFDLKINDKCTGCCAYCHENSMPNGNVPSLIELIDSKLYQSLHSGTEIAIGGGNLFESTDIENFLRVNKEKGVISNITVNQKHLDENKGIIISWIKNKLVYGIGISLTDSNSLDVDELGDNVIIHVINGLLEPKDLSVLKNKKVLILGYKYIRKGIEFYSDKVKENQKWLKDNLKNLVKNWRTTSFDCLAIEQLNPKETLGISDEEYNELFQGNDYNVRDNKGDIICGTMYIDLPNKQVARSSTASIETRQSFNYDETLEELFKKSIIGW